jgi:hypothetical protein
MSGNQSLASTSHIQTHWPFWQLPGAGLLLRLLELLELEPLLLSLDDDWFEGGVLDGGVLDDGWLDGDGLDGG